MIAKLHYISQGSSPKEQLENIQKACTSGAELVRLGLTGLSDKKILKAAQEAREITAHFQTRLLVIGNYKIAREVKADGVHFEKSEGNFSMVRKHLYTWQFIGGTASTLEEAEKLNDAEVDYIDLGPFRSLKNAAHKEALTLKGYAAIMDVLHTETPVLGFGGITIEDVPAILKTGISGLAISEEITRDFNKIGIFNQLLQASSTAEQRYTFE